METNLNRLEQIRLHPAYREAVTQIEEAERWRIYCGHGAEHCLDVARIMYILNLERHLNISKEVIYAAALLHDIGRAKQYTVGIPHDEAGVEMAMKILPECHFNADEIGEILEAIGDHRRKSDVTQDGSEQTKPKKSCLADLLKEADNLSRPCYNCKAEPTCKWTEDRKNHFVSI